MVKCIFQNSFSQNIFYFQFPQGSVSHRGQPPACHAASRDLSVVAAAFGGGACAQASVIALWSTRDLSLRATLSSGGGGHSNSSSPVGPVSALAFGGGTESHLLAAAREGGGGGAEVWDTIAATLAFRCSSISPNFLQGERLRIFCLLKIGLSFSSCSLCTFVQISCLDLGAF